MATKQEEIREGLLSRYKLEDDSQYYRLVGAHRNDIFPWRISKKVICEMDNRDWGALNDIVRIVCLGNFPQNKRLNIKEEPCY